MVLLNMKVYLGLMMIILLAVSATLQQLEKSLHYGEIFCLHYNKLKTECQQMSASGSTSDKMLKSLDNYADFLRFAANKYKSAQANAINRANRLPRY